MEGSGRGNTSRARPPPTCMDLIVSYPSNPARGPAARAPRPPLPVVYFYFYFFEGRPRVGPRRAVHPVPNPRRSPPTPVLPPDDDVLLRLASHRGLPGQQGQLLGRQRRAREVQLGHALSPSPAPGRLQARGVQGAADALPPDATDPGARR